MTKTMNPVTNDHETMYYSLLTMYYSLLYPRVTFDFLNIQCLGIFDETNVFLPIQTG